MNYRAISIFKAAQKAFHSANPNEEYVERKANLFVERCGGNLETWPYKLIPKRVIDTVAYLMLDADTEKVFYKHLKL